MATHKRLTVVRQTIDRFEAVYQNLLAVLDYCSSAKENVVLDRGRAKAIHSELTILGCNVATARAAVNKLQRTGRSEWERTVSVVYHDAMFVLERACNSFALYNSFALVERPTSYNVEQSLVETVRNSLDWNNSVRPELWEQLQSALDAVKIARDHLLDHEALEQKEARDRLLKHVALAQPMQLERGNAKELPKRKLPTADEPTFALYPEIIGSKTSKKKLPKADDPTFVTAVHLYRKQFSTWKRFRAWLNETPSARWHNTRQGLKVHEGDWTRYWAEQEPKASKRAEG